MASLPSISTFSFLFLFPFALAAVEPRQANWGPALGPDGPWNAVEVSLGQQPKISLFPGRMWQSFVTTAEYCLFNSSIPHCASGAFRRQSATSNEGEPIIGFQPTTQGLARGIPINGKAAMDLETIDLGFKDGFFPNHTLALIQTESEMYTYPGGKWYPIFTGCFSLGAQERYQVFTSDSAGKNPTINATMIPWALKDDGATTSSSFGLHYGSASPFAKVPGSLLYGGYDRNRVTGSILDFQGTFSQSITLQDISIDVIKGSSPFESIPSSSSDSSTITGLLAKGNSTITPSGLSLYIDPCSPYLTLPQSTCDAIASHLPVIYDASLGLYLWNTSSPRYKLIVASASALSFTFMGGRNTDSATIHIPFRHLNLTLTAPFTDGPTPYFPCFTGGTGEYVLGRAFLQDAFLGANWERSKFFLAQAPGPNIPAGVDPVSIQPDEETIKSGGNNWERSWEGFWSVLTPEDLEEPGKVDVGTNGTITSTSNDGAGNEKTGGEKPGLSTGAMVGIAVGAAVLGMALVGAGVFLWFRKKKAAQPAPDLSAAQPTSAVPQAASGEYYLSGYDKAAWTGPVEVSANQRYVFEMPGDRPASGAGH